MAHGLGAAGEHQIGLAERDVAHGRVQGLHPRAAVALDGPGRRRVAAAEPQRHDARDVGFVGAGHDATQDDLVEVRRLEWLPREQRARGVHGEVGGGEGSGPAAGLEERGAGAVHDEHGAASEL